MNRETYTPRYYVPQGGLAPQTAISDDKSVFTEAYLLIDKAAFSDITTSNFPHWRDTRGWIMARPLSGFAETFSHYIIQVKPGGGAEEPEPDPSAEGVIFVVDGNIELTIANDTHHISEGGYAYLPPGADWTLINHTGHSATFHWIRKRYEVVDGIDTPPAFVTNERDIAPTPMPDTELWSTTRFVDPDDLRHDMHVNIVNFEPGGVIPFDETHVMEHGLYVLSGHAAYRLNTDWHEVEAGDYMWLRAFCPQSCLAKGDGPFRYLLYKDVNRHPKL